MIDKFTELSEQVEMLQKELATDSLTGVHNRQFFFNHLDLSNFDHGRLYFVDLDGFKDVNDSKGHIYGDQLLCRFVGDLQACLGYGDILIRYAGDEFIIVTKKKVKLHSQFAFSKGVVPIRRWDDKRELLDKADKAMYKEKSRRKKQA